MTGDTPIRTLVVDDSDFFAQMTADTLSEDHGQRAMAVSSAEEALDTLDEQVFDCVVSDYEMPGMDGLELLDAVRDRWPDLPFILLTGRGDEEIASEAIAAGVADYLLKLEVVEDQQYSRLANRIEKVVEQHRAREKYELLVRNSPDALAQVTREGVVKTVNPAMAAFFDADRERLRGRRLDDLMGETGTDRIEAGRAAIESGETVRTEDEFDGAYFHNVFVPVDIRGERDTFQLMSRDITERKERERELRRQNERLEEFASVVSHDLRNPLNVARGALELIDDDVEHTDKIDRSLDRMETIISDVLTLARQGQTVSEPETVALSTLAEDAWSYVKTDEAALRVADGARIRADADRMQDLFSNLFRNAVQHNDGAVTVEIGVLADGFYVADDGEGIPPEERSEVFEMGYTTAEAGTGMGMTIVKQIAEAHGWTVDVTDSDAGGARFEITGVEFVE